MKTMKRLRALWMMIAVLSIASFASAQEANQTQTQPQTIDGNGAAYMQSTPQSGMVKSQMLSNGAVVIDNAGTVMVTGNDGTSTTVAKPAISISNEKTDMWANYPQWEAAFKNWISANPNFESYMSADELNYLSQGDAMGVYKVNYAKALNTQTRNQLNQANHE